MCSGHDKKDSTRPDMAVCNNLVDLPASNDLEGFKRLIDSLCWDVNGVGLWYDRQRGGAKRMLMEERTPLMIAATYGSVDVVKIILSLSGIDVNRSCGTEKTAAFHCAASGKRLCYEKQSQTADRIESMQFQGKRGERLCKFSAKLFRDLKSLTGRLELSGGIYKSRGFLTEWSKCANSTSYPDRVKGKWNSRATTARPSTLCMFVCSSYGHQGNCVCNMEDKDNGSSFKKRDALLEMQHEVRSL
ncbi:zinc finger CCCH domain-containing protein 30-like protein [Tanacetum coccineum]